MKLTACLKHFTVAAMTVGIFCAGNAQAVDTRDYLPATAKTPPMLTGFYSWKLAKGLYIVPLLFAYTPMLGGRWG